LRATVRGCHPGSVAATNVSPIIVAAVLPVPREFPAIPGAERLPVKAGRDAVVLEFRLDIPENRKSFEAARVLRQYGTHFLSGVVESAGKRAMQLPFSG
jgi:hypothetical protein